MADILDQAQVDALLQAVSSGDIDNIAEVAQTQTAENVAVYDFKRPERVGKEQLRALERLHEVFARNVSATMSSLLRSVVECTLEEIEQATYQEFTLAAPKTTCLNFLSAQPLEGEVILEINPRVVFVMFDKLVGGSASRTLTPDRPMTDIEWKVLDGVLARIRTQLRAAWEGVGQIKFEFTSHETNPQLAQTIPPNEPVVLITFAVTIAGEESGNMTLCLPHNVIEPVLNRMSNFWFSSKVHRAAESREYIRSSLSDAPVRMTAVFNTATIRTRDLLQLKVGDLIPLAHRENEPLSVLVNGKLKFRGMPGIFERRNRKALRISEVLPGHVHHEPEEKKL
ncbi:MAG: flagellar motor switch protein FliM [Planctomycetes bacterium]|nr:flagellar motor switch protein FliM [Planctomycetota bacterium]NUQ35602.1 flagellar motor switch protein FliM [Planctomycetaceae bacterium]